MHRRGYRSSTDDYDTTPIHRAAMKESLAAGLLMEAGWDKLISAAKLDGLKAVLIDPMTGSGKKKYRKIEFIRAFYGNQIFGSNVRNFRDTSN